MSFESALGLRKRSVGKDSMIAGMLGRSRVFAEKTGSQNIMHNVLLKSPLPGMLRQPVRGNPRMTNRQFMSSMPSLMSKMRDSDGDGVPNWLDCRPFDRKWQKKPNKLQMERVKKLPIYYGHTGRSIRYSFIHDKPPKHISEHPGPSDKTYRNVALSMLKKNPHLISEIKRTPLKEILFSSPLGAVHVRDSHEQKEGAYYLPQTNTIHIYTSVGSQPRKTIIRHKGKDFNLPMLERGYMLFHELKHAQQPEEMRKKSLEETNKGLGNARDAFVGIQVKPSWKPYWESEAETGARKFGVAKQTEISRTPQLNMFVHKTIDQLSSHERFFGERPHELTPKEKDIAHIKLNNDEYAEKHIPYKAFKSLQKLDLDKINREKNLKLEKRKAKEDVKIAKNFKLLFKPKHEDVDRLTRLEYTILRAKQRQERRDEELAKKYGLDLNTQQNIKPKYQRPNASEHRDFMRNYMRNRRLKDMPEEQQEKYRKKYIAKMPEEDYIKRNEPSEFTREQITEAIRNEPNLESEFQEWRTAGVEEPYESYNEHTPTKFIPTEKPDLTESQKEEVKEKWKDLGIEEY